MKNANRTHQTKIKSETGTAAEPSPPPAIANGRSLSPRERGRVRGNSASELPNGSSSNPQSSRRSSSKIAGLPASVRNSLNQMLDDGLPYEQIITKITALGYPGITHQNLSLWRQRGFQHWLEHRDHLEELRIQTDGAIQLATTLGDPANTSRASEILLSMQLYQTLLAQHSDPDPDVETQKHHATRILQLSRALGIHMADRSRRERLEFQQQKLKKQFDEPTPRQRKRRDLEEPLTPEERLSIIRKVDELLGVKLRIPSLPKPPTPSSIGDNLTTQPAMAPALAPDPCSFSSETSSIPTHANLRQPSPRTDENKPTHSRRNRREEILTSSAPSPRDTQLVESSHPESPSDSALCTPNSELPSPALSTPYPPAPIQQPPETIPVLNSNGVIIAWQPRLPDVETDPSTLSTSSTPSTNSQFPDAVAHRSRHGGIVCWHDHNLLAPGATHETPVRGTPHHIPVLDRTGRIIGWANEPAPTNHTRPSPTAVPLIVHGLNLHFAWLDESSKLTDSLIH